MVFEIMEDRDRSLRRDRNPHHRHLESDFVPEPSSLSNSTFPSRDRQSSSSDKTPDSRPSFDKTIDFRPSSALLNTFSPQLQHVVKYLLRLFDVQSDRPYWAQFPLCLADFNILQELAEEQFANLRLKYDYTANDETLTFRMPPSQPHSYVQTQLFLKIEKQLDGLAANYDNIRELKNDLIGELEMPITYPDSVTQRVPDIGYKRKSQKYPSIIGEIAFSQSKKNLARLAEEYLLELRGRLRVVFALKFEFEEDMKSDFRTSARLWIWRPRIKEGKYDGATCEEITIYGQNGEKNPDTQSGLRLFLEDFAFSRTTPGNFDGLDRYEVFIPISVFQDLLDEAAEQHKAAADGTLQDDDSIPLASSIASKEKLSGPYTLRSRDLGEEE